VVFDATEVEFHVIHDALDSTVEDISHALELFGRRLLTLLYSPHVQAMRRLMASEAGRSGLGKKCYELGNVRSQAELTEFIQQAMSAGKLQQADARITALHLVGLLESEWSAPFLFQVQEAVSTEEINATVKRAVTTFMRAYGLPKER
jgi:AefR-like transcriptional repressor, C-terminal domain